MLVRSLAQYLSKFMKDVIYQQLTKRCFVAAVEKNLAEEGRGYGLFAKSAFRSGDVIFEEYPIGTTAVAFFSKAHTCCSNCVRPLLDDPFGIPCLYGCHEIYCSINCRNHAYDLYHSVLCIQRNSLYADFYDTAKASENEYYIIAARLLLLFPNAPWLFHYCSPRWSELDHLSSPEDLDDEAQVMTCILNQILADTQSHDQISPEALSRTLGMLRINVLSIRHGDEGLGFALYSTQSLMNHAADPNCQCVAISCDEIPDNPSLCAVEAIKSIEPGEELTINYLATTAIGPERARILLQQYGIVEADTEMTV